MEQCYITLSISGSVGLQTLTFHFTSSHGVNIDKQVTSNILYNMLLRRQNVPKMSDGKSCDRKASFW